MGLAVINILATVVMMVNFNFQSQYNWSLYSGPWVLLSSFFLLYSWWYSDHSSYRSTTEKNLAARQKLQLVCILVNILTFLYCMSSCITLVIQLTKYLSVSVCSEEECSSLYKVILPVILIHIVTDILACVVFILVMLYNDSQLYSDLIHWKYNPTYQKHQTFRDCFTIYDY